MIEPSSEHPKVRFGRFSISVPGNKMQRTVLGVALCIGGCLGFLPILGFWMLPLGILILSLEYHWVRRFRRKAEIRFGRWRERRRNKRRTHKSGPV